MPRFLVTTCLASALFITAPGAQAQQAAPASVTAADAAPFIGDWTLNVESSMGPASIALSIKNADGRIAGEISSEFMPATPITEITRTGANLALMYSFTYEGNPVPVVVTLSPAAEKMSANLDFANGAFVMTGTATKAAPATN